jgi:hypothetical protein
MRMPRAIDTESLNGGPAMSFATEPQNLEIILGRDGSYFDFRRSAFA